MNDRTFKKYYLFIFGCAFIDAQAVLWSWQALQASYCGGFSCRGAQALSAQSSVVAARGLSSCGFWALEHRLKSCVHRLRAPLHVRSSQIEPVSPTLAGQFFTSGPPGKPSDQTLDIEFHEFLSVVYFSDSCKSYCTGLYIQNHVYLV